MRGQDLILRGRYGVCLNTKHLGKQLERFILDQDYKHYTVLCFNRRMTMPMARRILSIYAMMVDKYCLGESFAKRSDERYSFIAVPEHVDSNFHWNLYGLLPQKLNDMNDNKAEVILAEMFRRTSQSGTLSHEWVYDHFNLTSYILKEIRIGGVMDNFVLSTEFHRQK